ncbi:MAG: hypothetical protein ACOC4L_03930 [Halanaerobium sp.]
MQKGKLKYFSASDCWKIVNSKRKLFEPDPANIFIKIKLLGQYINCFIIWAVDGPRKNPGWYVQFWDAQFVLDKTQIYEVKFSYYDEPECPF